MSSGGRILKVVTGCATRGATRLSVMQHKKTCLIAIALFSYYGRGDLKTQDLEGVAEYRNGWRRLLCALCVVRHREGVRSQNTQVKHCTTSMSLNRHGEQWLTGWNPRCC